MGSGLRRPLTAALLFVLATIAHAEPQPTTAPSPFTAIGQDKILPNAHIVTDKIISGGQPEGDEGFKTLAAMGVKTIISVDGATPDIAAAKTFGLRYVHMPIGYDGVHREQGEAIAKALIELPGKIYLHCHHGKHRAAAAVAVACVFNGMLKPVQAESVLTTFGTGANYKGLWKDSLDARPLDPSVLTNLKVTYVEVAKINDLAATMVRVDEVSDRLKLLRKSGWRTPATHPDLDPPHEALMLEEHFREAGRLEGDSRPKDFLAKVDISEHAAKKLNEILATRPLDTKAADAAYETLSSSCVGCHVAYRD